MNIEEFDFSINLLSAIIWQYEKAKNILGLVNAKQDWYENNQTEFWQTWTEQVFNVLSIAPSSLANPAGIFTPADLQVIAFGLAVWSIILDIPLQIGGSDSPDASNKPIFGFDWQYPGLKNQNFYRSNFSNGNVQPTLTLDQQQMLLRLRYFNLTTRGDILDINYMLNQIFPGVSGYTGQVYALDTFQMSIQYIFTGALSASLKYILEQYDILPRPSAVGVKIYSNIYKIFGFGSFNQNFGHGCFIGE